MCFWNFYEARSSSVSLSVPVNACSRGRSAMVSDELKKQRRPKFREVSSRYLTPVSAPAPSSVEPVILLSNPSSSMASSCNKKYDTIAGNLGFDRSKDVQKPRRASSNEFIGFGDENGSSNENRRPVVGRSMTCNSSKSHNPGKSTSSSSSKRQSLTVSDNSGKISTASLRRMSVEGSSKYMNDETKRTHRRSSDPLILNSASRSVIKKTNSVSVYGSSTSQWALAPGRSDSPPISVENMEKPMSFSSLKPADATPKAKGVSSSSSPSTGSSVSESFHQYRMLYNRLLQWRFVNSRADFANKKISTSAEINVESAQVAVSHLRRSVLLKKLQWEKETIKMKMIAILHSQLKPLESWGEIERRHSAALRMTNECLRSVVCRIPLVEGARVETQSVAMELRRASDLCRSIESMMNQLSPPAQKTAALVSELTKVIAEEKLVVEKCFDLRQIISPLLILETSLKSEVMQLFPQLQWEEQNRIDA